MPFQVNRDGLDSCTRQDDPFPELAAVLISDISLALVPIGFCRVCLGVDAAPIRQQTRVFSVPIWLGFRFA